ncbi:tetratricopeptide repeat protein [Streptomyces sp. KK5PA1]|uniref:Tetratricopeptide repeat protein n=2 Tax=Actinacidiphila acididurans TaxID=2784346 RepID=A0ABS2TZ90_9ACTN|nr:tetratricopeptide repeat protein [Actinacidiphila acididurans]
MTVAVLRADEAAWRVLAGLLPGEDIGSPAPDDAAAVRIVAHRLARIAASRPELGAALRQWAAVSTANIITGGARVVGTTVQARDISGGIHVHEYGHHDSRLPVPRQLIPAPAHFTGREADLAALDGLRAAQRDTGVRIVVSGTAGVGKTALVSRWLGGLAPMYPGGQLYADLQGFGDDPADPGVVLGRFLRAFGVDHVPIALAEQTALWRTVTADLRIAVMLDNAYSAAQVRPLLPASPAALAVMTSRRRLPALGLDGAAFHQIGVLRSEDAVELLTHRLGRERVASEREAVQGLARLCGGLPLALCVAAARMAARPRQPLAVLTGAMSSDHDRLDALDAGGDRAVRTALDDSYAALPPDVARGYRQLGLLVVPEFGPDHVAAACDLTPGGAVRLLDELVDVNLVEELGHDRFRLHDLIRDHAALRAAEDEQPDARRAVVRRVLDWYLATATAARRLLSPTHRQLRRDYVFPPGHVPAFADEATALMWLDTEQIHLMAAIRLAAERGWDATAWQLVDSMQPLFLRRRPYDLWTEAHRIGLAAAERAGHPEGVSRMLTTGGSGFYNVGDYDEAIAWFTRALEGARRDGDLRAQAQALHGLGQSHRLAGRLEQAARLFRQALDLRETIGYARGAALSRLCLGDVALASGDAAGAVDLLTRARAALLAVPDPYDAARALAFLGLAHAAEGIRDFPAAEACLRQALAEFVRTGSVHWQAHAMEMLGGTAADRGDPGEARDWYEQSLALYTPLSPTDAGRLEDRLRSLNRS